VIDARKRSIAKALSWRISAIILLATVSFFVTNNVKAVTLIILFYHGIQTFVFFVHERVWNKIRWGRSKGLFIQMTGMSGAGKTTIARLTSERLRAAGIHVEVIDGDEYRAGLCNDLGFSKKDRNTNIRRLGFVSKVLARNNVVSIVSAINPYEEVRKELQLMTDNVKTVYIKCDLKTLKKRDTKGLYRKALLPDGHSEKIYNFTGISDPFEEPPDPDLVIETNKEDIMKSARRFEKFVLSSIS
jgi:adenylylsulfate kinase